MPSSALSLDWKLDPATSFLMFWMTPDELLSRILSFSGGVVGLRFSVFSAGNWKWNWIWQWHRCKYFEDGHTLKYFRTTSKQRPTITNFALPFNGDKSGFGGDSLDGVPWTICEWTLSTNCLVKLLWQTGQVTSLLELEEVVTSKAQPGVSLSFEEVVLAEPKT